MATLTSRTMLSVEKNRVWFQLQYNTPEMLKYAAINAVEEQWNWEIVQFLDANQTRVPATLRSPVLERYFPEFQKVLKDWSLKKRKKSLEGDIMSELTRLVKHPIDKHNGLVASDKKYSSCAAVGNSGILLNINYGKLIDAQEFVIWLNHARVNGFQNKVGSQTNISLVNSNVLHTCARMVGLGCSCHTDGADVVTVMYMCQPAHFMDCTVCNSFLKAPLLVTDPEFDAVCGRIVKYYSLKRFAEETGKGLQEWGYFGHQN